MKLLSRPSFVVVVYAFWALALSACSAPTDAIGRGKELYDACTNCHGPDAAGNQKFGAPPLAGQPAWYIEAQLKKFRARQRGAHPDDTQGMKMRPMAEALPKDDDPAAVAAYIATLPLADPPPVLEGGDPGAGKAAYTTCAACHGPDAAGNKALNAPNLTRTADWYLLTQLKNFKAGVRGRAPGDASGMTMAAISGTLADEKAMKDVIAYIMTLPAAAPKN